MFAHRFFICAQDKFPTREGCYQHDTDPEALGQVGFPIANAENSWPTDHTSGIALLPLPFSDFLLS